MYGVALSDSNCILGVPCWDVIAMRGRSVRETKGNDILYQHMCI
jgi:hypothetical protein